MEISFEEVLKGKKERVWPVIKGYLDDSINFPNFCKIPSKYTAIAELHQKLIADYPERKGKYFRPTLVLLTASAMGFSQDGALQTAAAMQVSEDWILNHDDIEGNLVHDYID